MRRPEGRNVSPERRSESEAGGEAWDERHGSEEERSFQGKHERRKRSGRLTGEDQGEESAGTKRER